jgi:microcystin-dependent protein
MARVKILEFGIIQKALANAVVTFYLTDADGANSGVKADLYQAATGSAARANPQTLDDDGKLSADCYVAAGVMATITGISSLTDRAIKKVKENPLEFSLSSTSAKYFAEAGSESATAAAASAAEAAAAAASIQTAADVVLTHADVVTTNANVVLTNADVVTTALNAAAAETSAAQAAGTLYSTSTTSLLIGVGSKTYTTQPDKNYFPGQHVIASSDADGTNYMHGQVISYSGTELIVNVTGTNGSGTYADWNIAVSGSPGLDGAGSGTVTSMSVATANGFSGTVANPTSTPAITIIAGAITPDSVNSVVISGSATPTLEVTGTSSISGANTGDQTLPVKATGAEIDAGTDDAKFVTPKALRDSQIQPVGVILAYAGLTEPSGWLFCYGQAISRTTYADLFTVLSTMPYGTGDGSTTFNVPDLRGRVVAGQDDMGGSSANRLTNQTGGLNGDTLGATGGAETHTLTTAQMPAHTHTVQAINSDSGASITGAISGSGDIGTINTSSTGSSSAHNNVQPTIVLNYIIKT